MNVLDTRIYKWLRDKEEAEVDGEGGEETAYGDEFMVGQFVDRGMVRSADIEQDFSETRGGESEKGQDGRSLWSTQKKKKKKKKW